MHTLGGEVLAGDGDVLGSDAQARARTYGTGIVEALGAGDHHAATGDAQVERLHQAVTAVLEQDIAAGHAEVSGAVLDVGRHVGGADDDHTHVRPLGGDDELARRFRVLERTDAGRLEQRHGLFEDAPLGEGEGNAGHSGLAGSSPARRGPQV